MTRNALVLLVAGALAGCGGPQGTPGGEDDAPLSNYDNLLAGAPDNKRLPDENKADAVYPALFTELAPLQSPVQSQGSRGVCSIFSTVALMESLYIKAGDPRNFSEQYLQWSVKREVGAFTNTAGSNARENLQAISQFGIPEETAWPYESLPWGESNDPGCKGEESAQPTQCFTNGDPPESAKTAPKYKLPRGRFVNTNSIKAHLTTKKSGAIIGLDFFYQSWNHRKSTLPRNLDYWDQGYVTAPHAKDIEESHKQRAGHSILIVGWDDNLEVASRDAEGKELKDAAGNVIKEKGFWLFKNSWGTAGFGIKHAQGPGYGWLSMKYVEDYGSAYVSDVPELTPPPPPPTGNEERFENTTAQDIPDNTLAGIKSELSVPTSGAIGELVVELDITHPYSGDLTVRIEHGGKIVVLQAAQGGSDDDIKKAFTVSEFKGAEKSGTWKLSVVDGAKDDAGKLNRWALSIR